MTREGMCEVKRNIDEMEKCREIVPRYELSQWSKCTKCSLTIRL